MPDVAKSEHLHSEGQAASSAPRPHFIRRYKMKNHIGRTLLVLILFIHSLTSLASSQSKYTPLIRQVRGWPSEKILSKGDQFLQNKKEDKALVMYMLVCSRTNDRMTDEELTDCSLANLKVGDIFYARGNYINALENYQEGLKLSETSASKTHLPLIYKNIGNVYCIPQFGIK